MALQRRPAGYPANARRDRATGREVRELKVLVVAGVVAAALGGCGGSETDDEPSTVSDDQRGVLSTIDALQSASRRGDAQEICTELFSETLARSIRRASKRSCQEEVGATLTSPDAQYSVARRIDIQGSRATATVREESGSTSRVVLTRDGDRWRIERIDPVASR